MRNKFILLLGIEPNRTRFAEKLLAALSGGLAIGLVYLISSAITPGGAPLLVASVSASAVLLFAVPHGAFSQPWPLLGGHGISALVGVTCAQWLGHGLLALTCAAGFALLVMYQLRCIHPPGGATALVAVLGGADIQALGYSFVLFPVLVNMSLLMLAALLLNGPFPWRRYPAALRPAQPPAPQPAFSPADIAYALRQLNTLVAVSDTELNAIFSLARQHAQHSHVAPRELRIGDYYSNGEYGDLWEVRQLVDGDPRTHDQALVIYKVVAGNGRRQSASITRTEFARWARYAVRRDETSWKIVAEDDTV